MYVLALSDYKQLAAAAGYKPAPQLGRQIAVYQHLHVVASQRHVNLTKETNKTQNT